MEQEKVKDWQELWIKYFTFDALIGNTDRHQDNWGILYKSKGNYLSPAFDNGTSMGREILEKYINRGYHHIRLSQNDAEHVNHMKLIEILLKKFGKKAKRIIINMLSFNDKELEEILEYLVELTNINPLSKRRAYFIRKLILKRKELLLRLVR
ncbi:MAG: HipA domain-containing protein [Elusimicrobiota bacterium]